MNYPLSEYALKKMPKPGCGLQILFILVSVVTAGIGFIIGIFIYFCMRHAITVQNNLDYEAAVEMKQELSELSAGKTWATGDTQNIRVLNNYAVGEVARHFDSQTNSQITGWLEHNLSAGGWGFTIGLFGLEWGDATAYIQGKSTVNLDIAGTARDNLMGDGFVAVFQENPYYYNSNIVRVAVPSDPVIHEYIASLLQTLGKSFGEGSHRDIVLKESIASIQGAARNDVSYVSDCLNSILRMDPNCRPRETIVGMMLTEHAILGSAIQFSNDQQWYQLFPAELTLKVIGIASNSAKNVPV